MVGVVACRYLQDMTPGDGDRSALRINVVIAVTANVTALLVALFSLYTLNRQLDREDTRVRQDRQREACIAVVDAAQRRVSLLRVVIASVDAFGQNPDLGKLAPLEENDADLSVAVARLSVDASDEVIGFARTVLSKSHGATISTTLVLFSVGLREPAAKRDALKSETNKSIDELATVSDALAIRCRNASA